MMLEDDPGHEIDLVLLGTCRPSAWQCRVLLVVGDDDLGRQSAKLAVKLPDRQIEPVADVDAKPGAWTGERGHETT